MSYLLKGIIYWPNQAVKANWSVKKLAKQCGISVRTLERHFQVETGLSPQKWLNNERQCRAIELLRDGSTIKETADVLGYKTQHALSRAFKKYYGVPPKRHSEIGKTKGIKMGNHTSIAFEYELTRLAT